MRAVLWVSLEAVGFLWDTAGWKDLEVGVFHIQIFRVLHIFIDSTIYHCQTEHLKAQMLSILSTVECGTSSICVTLGLSISVDKWLKLEVLKGLRNVSFFKMIFLDLFYFMWVSVWLCVCSCNMYVSGAHWGQKRGLLYPLELELQKMWAGMCAQ